MKKKSTKRELNPTLVNILKVVAYAIGLFFAGIGTENTGVAMGLLPF